MGAVKNAVQRDELDPTVLDLDPEKSLESQLMQGKEDDGDDKSDYDGATAEENKVDVDVDIESRSNDGPLENADGSCDRGQDETSKEEVADEPEPDPRKALMAMLSNRAPQTQEVVEEPASEAKEAESEETDSDPRIALVAMLNKRAPPSPTPALVDEEPTTEAKEEDEVKDPRAALMTMLSKRSPPAPAVVEEPSNAESKEDEETEPDPRAALMSMLNKRAPPTPAVDESKNEENIFSKTIL